MLGDGHCCAHEPIMTVLPWACARSFQSAAHRVAPPCPLADDGPVNTDMSAPRDDAQALAQALRRAEDDGRPIAPPSLTSPGLTVQTAYRIQRHNIEARLAAGERQVGHKVGLTSRAMQQQLGVDQPDFGVLTDRMQIADGGRFDPRTLIAPRIEPEFAFRIGEDLPAGPGLAQLRAAIDGVAVALEIIDSRVADWKIALVDTVADNASSARVVWGEFASADEGMLAALPAREITLRQGGAVVAAGPGSAVLGDPLVSLHWLATAIGAFGERFRAGDRVLAGAVCAAVPLTGDGEWEAGAPGLAPVRFTAARD